MNKIKDILASIKTRKATTVSKTQHLGRSIHDKLQNLLQQDKTIITHAYFPEGNLEKVAAMKAHFVQQFGFDLPPELVSFYEIFDGFELRTLTLGEDMQYFLEDESWLISDFKLPPNFADLPIQEWQTDAYKDAFSEIGALLKIEDTNDLGIVTGRTTIPHAQGMAYYHDHTHELDNYGKKTIIPAADQLFSNGNKSGVVDGLELYYFDFFSHFSQIVLGIKDGKIALYQVKYGYGELSKIRENIPTYLKKIIIRA